MIYYIFSIIFLLSIAPLLLGFIKSIQMLLFYKKMVSIFQPYRNFAKLLKKEVVISQESSSITKIAPFLVLSPLVLIVFFLPPIFGNAFYVSFMDAFTITGLIALSTFFLMLLGLDSGNSFGGMGSSREAFISALVEPAMILNMFSISMMAGDLDIAKAGVNLSSHFPVEHMSSFIFAGLSFFILLLTETGRIPVDNPQTHLELTMIHEAMILDISGFYLLLIEMAASVKFVIFASLFASLFMPIGLELSPIFALLVFIAKLFIIAIAVALIETNMAKLRLFKVPNLLGVAIVFAFLSLITFYVLEA
ncbi:MAG: hydrogenase [Helicobacteraceae bacterium CG2_30_36_10]|nr:MAG: hydrogenase [Helicobacteraceae bacterium CG2_30_36_10]